MSRPGDAVERLLQRDGDQRLDLRRPRGRGRPSGSPPAAGRTRGRRRPAMSRSWANAEEHQRRGQRDDDEAEPQARADDRTHHRPRPPFSPAPGTVVPARSFAFDPELRTLAARSPRRSRPRFRRAGLRTGPRRRPGWNRSSIGLADEHIRLRAGEGPRRAVDVVEDRAVRDRALPPRHLRPGPERPWP